MEQFVGRKSEMDLLNSIYEEESVKTCMIYGRRRIGKTTLIEHFISDKPSINIEFDDSTYKVNLDVINRAISVHTGNEVKASTIRESMDTIKAICCKEKMVVVFDELPFFTSNFSGGASEIQHLTDWLTRNTDSMVIIAGSSVSLMLDEVMGADRPLYKRFMFTINLGPLGITDVRELHPNISDDDLMRMYLTLGGISAYHRLVGDRGYRDAMNRYVLNRFGFIQSDVQLGIVSEMGGNVSNTISVFKAIADGDSTYGEIRNRTGLDDPVLKRVLDSMMVAGLLRKTDSMITSRKSKIYSISDPTTSFYYDIIDRNRAVLESAEGDAYRNLEHVISAWLGKGFEDYCRNFVREHYACSEVGSWWGKAPLIKDGRKVKDEQGKVVTEDVDIDLVAVIRRGNDRIDMFGECKFTKAPMGFSSLNNLVARVEYLKGHFNARYTLFSLSGFSDDLREYAEEEGIMLFDLDVLVSRKSPPELE
jgi:AAA+ ATPase superfamily predicted ATPase